VRSRQREVLGIAAVAGDADLAEEIAAQGLVAEVAEIAGAAEEIEVRQHAIAHARARHGVAGGDDSSDDLVTGNPWKIFGPPAVIAAHVVEDRQPDATRFDLDEDLAGRGGWPRHRLVADLAAPLGEDRRVHRPARHGGILSRPPARSALSRPPAAG